MHKADSQPLHPANDGRVIAEADDQPGSLEANDLKGPLHILSATAIQHPAVAVRGRPVLVGLE